MLVGVGNHDEQSVACRLPGGDQTGEDTDGNASFPVIECVIP
jgi:hypothetical protein